MFSKLILTAITVLFAAFSGIAACLAASPSQSDASRAARSSDCYEMATYKWDPETQQNVFVGYRKICR